MYNKYDLLNELLPYLEEYEESMGKNQGLDGFAHWLVQHRSKDVNKGANPNQKTDYTDPSNIREDINRDVEISTSLSSLYKFAKHYTKKVLIDTPLKTMDDFGFMAALMRDDKMSKSELIRENLLEITTGTEIIKRLIREGLLHEESDPNDKRSKIVSATNKGKGLMYGLFTRMGDVAGIVTGHLSEEEKEEILVSFRKLKQFHLLIHKQDKGSDVNSIQNKYW